LAGTAAIRAGKLIDPATGTVSKDQIILIKDGKIAEVGPRVQIPDGAEVIDLSQFWVLPGLMDAHTHITMNLPPVPPGVRVWEAYLVKESSAFRALRGIQNARAILEAGFTAVRDVGNAANYADSDVRRAIEAGWFAGPTILNTGKIIAPFGGQFKDIAAEQGRFWQFEYIDADTPDEIRKAVRQNLYYGAKAIKLVADEYAYHYTEGEIRAAVEEAHHAGVKVAVHASGSSGGEGARNAILGGADSIEHGFYLSDELLDLMKKKGTVLVGTDFPYEHLLALGGVGVTTLEAKATSERILQRLRRAYQIGVKMAFGTDTVADLPGKNRAEMMLDYLKVWTDAGIPAAQILNAMTTNAAELFGIQKERGAIAPGQAADIIAAPENPLENIQALRRVQFVMKDGRMVKQPRAMQAARSGP
jgi:imidazolonepropionase-like amidohydrolase